MVDVSWNTVECSNSGVSPQYEDHHHALTKQALEEIGGGQEVSGGFRIDMHSS